MSEVEVYQPQGLAPVGPVELETMVRQSELLAQSTIIPRDYRGKPANILVAAMTGRTFGWDVMTAMRNGHVIEGTWSIKPEAMLALVRRAGHSVTGETTPEGATVRGKRGDTGDEMTVTFAMGDAVRAGLANKTNWKQYPQSMCWARAVSQLCRMLFADVTLGLSYTPEELGAEVDADGEVIAARPALSAVQDDPHVSAANAERMRQKITEAGCDVAQVVMLGTDGRTDDPAKVLKTEVEAMREALAACIEAREQAERDGAESDAQQEEEAEEAATYAPDDLERPFGDGEMEPPFPDPETGEAY